ncbi:diaminopimelate epimerase [Candidatus Nitrosacidococcus tergens]|uniref:Diaminopimelate epimerase n=1 Tax=Candidatus Nitrosacidococcus tergens TaxID=553981 RepID=A0A7G1Q7F9_9GAMM|nr:diaminopimelate epimerase [Candidatus Nitrosacidococcus tergens]CAB1274311.1 diaminopimelate epimerase [Candidatus Nitrosacidococcus tergens]
MDIAFTKMQGLGNDFVVINTISQPISLTSTQIKYIADRRLGIGCDQVLLITPPPSSQVDFGYRIFNQDGGEVEQCGNGARCFAHFIHHHDLSNKNILRVATKGGVIQLRREENECVTVDMGIPRFDPKQIPFKVNAEALFYPLTVANQSIKIGAVSMGNPHCVLQVPDITTAPVGAWGLELESHPLFPQRVNVGFIEKISSHEINLRVYERGVGETPACGTGACAAVAVGRKQGWLDESVSVHLLGGSLHIIWQGENSPLLMTGPSKVVFEGSITLNISN